ncbi:MAG: universal stress protein, partial [Verrucomicrobiota bacterium]|nr:universal stress protein [Verrucomicrobiota bacterium]
MVKAAKQKKRPPKRPKKILVPIDFSASAKSAFRHAIGLAGNASRIILLHVIAPSAVNGSDVKHLIAAAEASLTSFSKSDGPDHDHAAHSLVRIGTPFHEILAAAAENDVELIVLGVHDSAPLRGLALGHTA